MKLSEVPTPAAAREREIFLEALEIESRSQRVEFVRRACGSDAKLVERVEGLLREHDEVGDFLVKPAIIDPLGRTPITDRSATEGLSATLTEKPGDWIGRYKLLQQIGEGGCGVVYMAEQEQPVRRRVALKVIKLGMDTKSVIARFEAERQALAMMDHPNIAKVLDAGATDNGRPYFVMELVRGIKITDYCNQNNLPTHERLKLFIQVCQAIQHAHQKGVIHRDIKPSNILVTLHDGTPVPKVIDFGIAKATEQRLTDKTLFTEFTAFIGTPAYMSPEQAEMSGLDIDTRSDIYSLGVLLYELLTGKTPFDAETLMRAGLDECRRTIREREPLRPSTRLATMIDAELATAAKQRHTEAVRLIHLLKGDLDWVVMKCLEKDRTRRFPTANDLAMDIHRYLANEPVEARPPSNWYRFQKLLRRHRGAVAAAAAITLILIVGASVSTWLAIRATKAEKQESELRRQAEKERERAELEKVGARLNEYVANINLAQIALKEGNVGRAVHLVNKHWPKPGEPDLRGFEWRYLWQLCQGDEHVRFPNQGAGVHTIAVSPNGEWLAVGQREKVTIWRLQTRALVTTLSDGATSLVFTPDNERLITGTDGREAAVRIWRTSDWQQERELAAHSGPVTVTPRGDLLIAGSRQGLRVLETSGWTEVRQLRDTYGPMSVSPDSQWIAAESRTGMRLYSLRDEQKEIPLENAAQAAGMGGGWMRNNRSVAFSPDGRFVAARRRAAAGPPVFDVGVWETETGREAGRIPSSPDAAEHTGEISTVLFSPDGRVLVTGSWDHSIRIWDFETRRLLKTLQGHLNEVWSVTFAADGQSILSSAKDGGLYLWPTPLREKKKDAWPDSIMPLAIAKDNRVLVGIKEGQVQFVNLATHGVEQEIPISQLRPGFGPPGMFGFGQSVSVSGDLKWLAHAHEQSVQLWNTETRESTLLNLASTNGFNRGVDLVALSADARFLVAGRRGRPLRWWDLGNETNAVLNVQADRILMAPDSRTLAAFQGGTNVYIWDVAGPVQRSQFTMEIALGPGVAFSPDARLLAVTDFPGLGNAIRLWDVQSGKLVGICMGHKQGVFGVAFSPDGKTLATASNDNTVKLWNVATQQELLTLEVSNVHTLLFSADGQILLSSRLPGTPPPSLQVYRAPLLGEIDRQGNPGADVASNSIP